MAEDDLEPAAGGEPARKGRYVARHRKAKSRRSGARRLLIGVNIVVALALITAALGTAYAEVQLHRINHIAVKGIVKPGHSPQSPSTPSGPPMTVLIVGSDSRAALKEPGDSQFGGSGDVGGARSDTIILARIVPATHSIELLSVPRDLYVDIPGMGMQKINAAIGSSPNLLIQVLHTQLGIDINHYVDVDFDSFRQIADAIGGVEVYFPTKAKDSMSGLNIPAPGCYNLEGDTALSYVRSRDYQYYEDGEWHQEAASDLARIQRQQGFIRKMIKKAESTGLTSPLRLNGIISGLTNNVTVDSTFSINDMISLVKDFGRVNAAKIPGVTLATDAETTDAGEDVLLPEKSQDAAQVGQFLGFGQTPAAPTSSGPTGATTTTTTPGSSTTLATPESPSSITLQVENGAAVEGQAAQAEADFQRIGFKVSTVGTASTTSSGPTQILYGYGSENAARTVAAYVEGPTVLEESSSLSASTVEVLTSTEFAGVKGSPSPSSSGATSSSSSSSTTVPPTTSTTEYQLPGTPNGQAVPNCGT